MSTLSLRALLLRGRRPTPLDRSPFRLRAALPALLVLILAPVAGAQTLVNGAFDAGPPPADNNPFGNGSVPGWTAALGTPQLVTVGPRSAPYSAAMWSLSSGNVVVGEGILQQVSIPQGARCRLSYQVRRYAGDANAPAAIDQVVVGLARAATSGLPVQNLRSGNPVPNIPGAQILDRTGIASTAWTPRAQTFIAAAAFDQLFFFPQQNPGSAQGWLHLDDVVLDCCPAAPNPGFTLRQPECPGAPTGADAADTRPPLEHRWDVLEVQGGGYVEEGTFQCWGPSCTFSYPFEPGRCYAVKHGVYKDPICPWEEERQVFCVPAVVGVEAGCADPEVCARLACEPGEVFTGYDERCGCACIRTPEVCPQPLADAGPDRVLCPGVRRSDVTVGGPGVPGCRYRWSPADGLQDPAAAASAFWLDELDRPRELRLEVECDTGCRGEDRVTVTPGAAAGTIRVERGRWPWPLCGTPVRLSLAGYSGWHFDWECAPSPGGPWAPCPGGDRQGPAYTHPGTRERLWIRVKAVCDEATALASPVQINPFCFEPPDVVEPPDRAPGGGFVQPFDEPAEAPVAEPAGPAEPAESDTPAITGCTPRAFATQEACVCGRFPDPASRAGVRLDGEPPGESVRGDERVLWFALPEALDTGPHRWTGDPGAGFAPSDACTTEGLALAASLDREQLYRGEGTELRLAVAGTEAPVSLRIVNRTPQVIALEGGDEQRLTTSGGADNAVTRRVRGLQRGDFGLVWEVEPPSCPCAEGSEGAGGGE